MCRDVCCSIATCEWGHVLIASLPVNRDATLLPVSGDVATGIRTWEPLTLVFYQLTLVCAKKNLYNLHKDSNQTLKPKLNCGLGSRQSGRGLGRDTLQFLQMSVEVAKINIRVCLLDNKNDGD